MSEEGAATPGRDAPAPRDGRVSLNGRLGVLTIGMSVAVWWPAFTYGAWGTLFFYQLLALWAASTAAFVFVVVERRPRGARLARVFVLLLPSVWLALALATPTPVGADEAVLLALIGDVAALAIVVTLPFTLWVLARIVWPDLGASTPLHLRLVTVAVVLGVGAASIGLGSLHSRFLTCEDFTISGNSEPPGCVHAEP